jgi:hypothetical protein
MKARVDSDVVAGGLLTILPVLDVVDAGKVDLNAFSVEFLDIVVLPKELNVIFIFSIRTIITVCSIRTLITISNIRTVITVFSIRTRITISNIRRAIKYSYRCVLTSDAHDVTWLIYDIKRD